WKAMGEQAKLMQGQVGEMGKQTDILSKSVSAAEKSAEAAKENMALIVSKERPRISINKPASLDLSSSGPHRVEYKLNFSGLTTAYILESLAIAGISDSRDILPDDTVFTPPVTFLPNEVTPVSTPVYGASAWIMPDMTVPKTRIDELVAGKKFVHFWGFVRFRDAFFDVSRIERVMKFHYTWRYTGLRNIGSSPSDLPFGLWDGQYEEEEKSPN